MIGLNIKLTSVQVDSTRFQLLNKYLNQFTSRIRNFEFPRLIYLNWDVNYRVPAKVKEEISYLNTNYPGAKFNYTTDGKDPNLSSSVQN